jgi:predicted nucleic acid-binding protein
LKNGGSGNRTNYLLDTSALMALLEGEAGADRVEQLLRTEAVLLPFMSVLEVHYVTIQEEGEEEANARYAMLQALRAVHLNEVDEPTLLAAAHLKAHNRISLADAIIAAFAERHGAVLVHKDPEFEALAGQVRLEALPYKTRKR